MSDIVLTVFNVALSIWALSKAILQHLATSPLNYFWFQSLAIQNRLTNAICEWLSVPENAEIVLAVGY